MIWEERKYNGIFQRYTRFDTRSQVWTGIDPPDFNIRIWNSDCVCVDGSMFCVSDHPNHTYNSRRIIVEYNIYLDHFSSFPCPITNAGKITKVVDVDGFVGVLVSDKWDDLYMNISVWVADQREGVFIWRIHHVFFRLHSDLIVVGFFDNMLTCIRYLEEDQWTHSSYSFEMLVCRYTTNNAMHQTRLTATYPHPYSIDDFFFFSGSMLRM